MIVLRYPAPSAQLEDWKDLMEKLALAHKLEQDAQLQLPVLTHSGATYEDGPAITAYLDQLDRESEQWWYCTCDRR